MDAVCVAAAFFPLAGCAGRSEWEIAVENKGAVPCSVYVTLDYADAGSQGSSEAHIENMAASKSLSLLVGDTDQTIRSVRVVLGKEEQILKPNAELRPGQRYLIVVTPEGKLEASLVEGK